MYTIAHTKKLALGGHQLDFCTKSSSFLKSNISLERTEKLQFIYISMSGPIMEVSRIIRQSTTYAVDPCEFSAGKVAGPARVDQSTRFHLYMDTWYILEREYI